MTKWEYQVTRLQGKLPLPGLIDQLEAQLNTQGKMGWELVTVVETPFRELRVTLYLAVFKRPYED
jgi:hypothetical protein